MKRRVEITHVALEELEAAHAWIAQQSQDGAERWRVGLYRAADSLEQFAERCPYAIEKQESGRNLRNLIHGSYRLIFEIEGDTVFVLHIRHGAREPLTDDEI